MTCIYQYQTVGMHPALSCPALERYLLVQPETRSVGKVSLKQIETLYTTPIHQITNLSTEEHTGIHAT